MFIYCLSIQNPKKRDNSSPPVPKEKVFKGSDVFQTFAWPLRRPGSI